MDQPSPIMQLLSQRVPLSLLIDLAGFGDSSDELYRAELEAYEPVAVAS